MTQIIEGNISRKNNKPQKITFRTVEVKERSLTQDPLFRVGKGGKTQTFKRVEYVAGSIGNVTICRSSSKAVCEEFARLGFKNFN